MSSKASVLPLLLSFFCFLHVSTAHNEPYCDSDVMRVHVANACRNLISSHISKRQVDLADYGYTVENMPNKRHSGHKNYHGHHSQLNKLTHPDFPKGVYLLFRNINANSPSNNEIHEQPEPLDNEILASDMQHLSSNTRRSRQRLISSNRKFKRDAETDKILISKCCYGACNHLFCN